MKTIAKLWLGIIFLALLSPLGLVIPQYFRSNAAWGEWGIEKIKGMIGYIPQGIEKLSGFWKAPISGYAFGKAEDKGLAYSSIGYILSAVIGIAVAAGIIFIIGKILSRKK